MIMDMIISIIAIITLICCYEQQQKILTVTDILTVSISKVAAMLTLASLSLPVYESAEERKDGS